jgi:transcription elongation factor GreB
MEAQVRKNYITAGGADKLKAELRKLLHEERPELVKTITWAASNGDRSENGDYIYGKRRLRQIDSRIRFLTKRLESAEIVDPEAVRSDRVRFGARVTIVDEDERKRVYRIVGVDETDAANGSVSWVSPVAKALLNARVGDVVRLRSPKGEEDLEIVKIEY